MSAQQHTVDEDVIVTEEDVSKLLTHFAKNSHRVKTADIKGETIMEKCTLLFRRDYKFTIVPNLNGELCGHYPMKLIISEFERDASSSSENVESQYNQQLLTQHFKNARCARCRSRFVVPVILFQGKHICRSATLSGGAEMFGRSTTDYLMSNQGPQDIGSDMFDKYRGNDIELLKFFDVGYICDLMVEKKKTKLWMPITSSEKVDKENRYSDFSILCMPYPGCEFFKDWKDNSYIGEATLYDWGQSLNDSKLDLPTSPLVQGLSVNWEKYTEWNLVELTQNYLKLLLQYIKNGPKGLLIHCISGWDRTPLFISLLRLSLWADGLIHQSLSTTEILYLTLGYDWYLFGHDLPDRLNSDQEVMYFCFKMLKDIGTDEFSIQTRPSERPSSPVTSPQRVTNQQQHSPQQRPLANHRVDSDLSLGINGVFLGDDQMNFPPSHGSLSSLNSYSDAETSSEQINFTLGVHEEEEENEGDTPRETRSIGPNLAHRRSLSPTGSQSSHRLNSPRHSSPTLPSAHRRQSLELSLHSNHFTAASPKMQQSSPMAVPSSVSGTFRGETGGHMPYSNSVGSWQIISSFQGMETSTLQSSTDPSSSSQIGSCHEAMEINLTSLRWQRLDAVSRMFEHAYGTSISSSLSPGHSSMGSGLSSFLGRVAEQVGLKGARQNSAPSLPRTGV